MFGMISKILAGLFCLGAIALVGSNFWANAPQVFDPEGMKAAQTLDEPVPISMIFDADVHAVCIIGPYSSPEVGLADTAPSLAKQMQPSSVDEQNVRVATFDAGSVLLAEHELPRTRGEVRLELVGIGDGFCQEAEDLMIRVIDHSEFVSVRIVK